MVDVGNMSFDDLGHQEVYDFQGRAFKLVVRWACTHARWPVKWTMCTDLQTLRLSVIGYH